MHARYIDGSEELVGYRVRINRREAFSVTGYTILVPRGRSTAIRDFWSEVAGDGRLDRLSEVSSVRAWLLGLGSWDPGCPKGGQRYTICVEATDYTDFSALAADSPLFTKEIGASDWMCFETTQSVLEGGFWRDNPYKMMGKVGYGFNTRDYSVGLHIDAYPPDYHPDTNPAVEFWIAVVRLESGPGGHREHIPG